VAPDGSVTVGNGTTNKDGTPVLRDGTDAPQSAKSNGGGSLTFAILGGVALLLPVVARLAARMARHLAGEAAAAAAATTAMTRRVRTRATRRGK
jgi:hypothetical protein